MLFPKPKRKINKELLKSFHGTPCAVCKTRYGTVAHHIKTKGARGDDVLSNLISLCVVHHREIHDLGFYTFNLKYSFLDLKKKRTQRFNKT